MFAVSGTEAAVTPFVLLAWYPVLGLTWFAVIAVLIVLAVRTLAIGMKEEIVPLRSFAGYRVWATARIMDMARDLLIPRYAGLHTAAAHVLPDTAAAKWICIGCTRRSEHPLWSSLIWRSELADTFVELVAAPWFARTAIGTPALVWYLRCLGAKIGQGVWCKAYWLPEADLVSLGDTTVGPASLVMRGAFVPANAYFMCNPVAPWIDAPTIPAGEDWRPCLILTPPNRDMTSPPSSTTIGTSTTGWGPIASMRRAA